MKTCFIVVLVLSLSVAAVAADGIIKVEQPQDMPSFLGYVPDRFIVVMKQEVAPLTMRATASAVMHIGDPAFDQISDRFAVSSIRKQFTGSIAGVGSRTADLARYYKVDFQAGTLEEAMAAYRTHPNVERVEPIGIHAMYATPNDGYYDPYQWHLNATSDHDIDAPEAWDIQVGSDATIVAILDSGTRYYHPDLGGVNASPTNVGASRGNMWINNTELNGSAGVDDDGNGYTDDWIGYDFIDGVSNCWTGEDCNTKDNDPRDFNGHGTHTSGIFGMITNDGYGMAGVAGGWGSGSQAVYGNGVRIMALRMGYSYNYLGQEYGVVMMDAAAEAFYYAADNGAKIASCSWGSSNSGGIGAAADYFLNAGGVIFVAAGNDGSQTADYLNGRGDIVSVSATDQNDNGASFTTYGTWVDICAPGVGIYATYHDHTDPNTNYWAALDGTSMATPMVAGVAALIWSQNPSWTAAQVTSQLYSSADNIDAYLSSQYIGKMGAGRINAYNAVNTGPPPPPVAEFSGTPTSGTEPLTVNFTDLSTGSISSWSWTFGDGGTSTAQHPSHQYTSAGSYTVSLTVTGPGGSDPETKTNYITVDPCVAPTAGFVGSPTSGDYPLAVNFTNQSSGATSYSWTFGDGGTSTATNPGHTYTAAGTYTVTLTATNACGSDVETKVDYITVTTPPPPPVAAFTGTPTSGCAPLLVNFTDQSTGTITAWSWTFGDGGTSTAQNPSHTYTAGGTYTVALTVTGPGGNDTETKTGYIAVTASPTADFIGSPTSGTYPLLVNFTDQSTGAATWSWTFGDGGTSTAQNPSHSYTAAGTYTVALTVTNACGSDVDTKVDYITVTDPAAGYASLPYSTGFESGSFDQYWETYSNNAEGRIQITTANTPRGTYHLTMDDNLNGGLYAQNEAWLKVDLAGKSDVDLVFWWKEFSDEDHTQDGVFFSDNGGSSFTKVYNLTGGSATYQQIALDLDQLAATNGLSLTGTFVIKFQQYDNYGITTDGMAFDDVSVVSNETPPVAEFSGTPTAGEVPLEVAFTDLSSGSPTSWSWTFGDGGTATTQNPSHTYTAAGTYTVSLTATNAFGSDGETKTNYITVTCTPPVADFVGSPTSGGYPLTVNFTDQSTGATSWSWTFGDGGTSTAQSPSHEYTAAGTYTVTLTATNPCGSDGETKVDYITVTEPSAEYAVLPYSTGFETGSFDQYWFTRSDNSEGRILITTANTPRGTYHLTMDDNLNGGLYAQNEAWLKVNLAGKSDVDLVFWWKEFSDEDHTQDGVFFSDNGGSSFTKVYNLTGGATTYGEIALDLDQLASANGLSLTGTFVIKFQQYDNYGIATDGMAFDDISVTSNEAPPVADFVGSPTAGGVPLTVNFTDQSSGDPTSWSWTFGDGGTSTAQNPSHEYATVGTYTVTLTATNAFGSDVESKPAYITVNPAGAWTVITYDDFEGGWGNYTDGGGDCALYVSGTYAHQGNNAADIQDNSGVASSFYHTVGYNVAGYTELEVEFWYIAVSMDNSAEDFWLQYFDGSAWQTVETWARSIDFDNGVFYHEIVTISSAQYNFPSNARLRFMCDASGNRDDVYIDEIEWRGSSGVSAFSALDQSDPLIPEEFALAQNYPNPFNPTTTIGFSLPVATDVTITIYNISGQVVERVGGHYEAGLHSVVWDAGHKASGVYFYRIEAGPMTETRKMILLK